MIVSSSAAQTICPPVHLCQNGATCVNDQAGYKCACKPGYRGYFCEGEHVKRNPFHLLMLLSRYSLLRDNVKTEHVISTYRFTLSAQYFVILLLASSGAYLLISSIIEQIDPCESSPCLNGATCMQSPSDILQYICECPKGYTGTTCEGKQLSLFFPGITSAAAA